MQEMAVKECKDDEHIVWMCAQTLKKEVLRGTMKECEEFCDLYGWELVDENRFVWRLEID